MYVRLIHFSDTHLGHSDYSKIDPESGANVRENDIYDVFREIIDYILKTKPDLVIHAGDLFDSVRPSNRAISVAMEELSRLSKAQIPTVIIAGNHSTPRQKSTDSVFKTLRYFPHVYPIFGGMYETRKIGDCTVHALPHSYSDEDLQRDVKRLEVDKGSKFNIMVAHAAIRGVSEASWGEFKEQVIPKSSLLGSFDYIALGHYHRPLCVADNAHYCGSPERFRFSEIQNECGFLDVRLNPLSVKHVRTRAREMISLGPIDCRNLDASDIESRITDVVSSGIDGKIIKIVLDRIPRHVRSALDGRQIREIMSGSLHYEFEYKYAAEKGKTTSSRIGTMDEEFEDYVRNRGFAPQETEEILRLGREYLADVEEEHA